MPADQTLVHRHLPGIGHAFGDRLVALKPKRLTIKVVSAAVAAEIRSPGGKALVVQPHGDLPPVLNKIAILRRLGLLLFQHDDHNQRRHHPFRDLRFVTAPFARARHLGRLKHRDGHLDQTLQAMARPGLPSHPWDLLRLPRFLFREKKHNHGGSMRLEQLNHETPSNSRLGTPILEPLFRSRCKDTRVN